MSTKQLQATPNVQRLTSRRWWLLGSGLLVIVAGLVIYNASQRTPVLTEANNVAPAQAISNVMSQSFTDAVKAYNSTGGQRVPDAATQGILGYIQAHNGN